MVSALTKRTAAALAVSCCAGVVLGLSACIANHNRIKGLFSGEVVWNLVVGSLTLLFEGVWTVWRYRSDGWDTAYAVELVAASILWVLWLAAASAYTAASGHMRVICTDYDQLLAAAKMAGNDDASIAAAKNEFKAGCPRLSALTAFLWLGWIALTFILVWTLYLATRPEATWRSSFRYPNERVRGSGESGGEKRFARADGRRPGSTSTTPRNGSIV